MCSPRGSAFLLVDPDRLDQLRPGLASWWSSTDPVPFYAESLRLPDTAKRLDTTPVWTAWPGTLAALRALAPIGVSAIGAHVYRLAARLRHGLALAEADSAILLLTEAGAAERLASAGITVATTPAGARLSFHLYTTQADIDRVLDVLAG